MGPPTLIFKVTVDEIIIIAFKKIRHGEIKNNHRNLS
jgi:hypothetical protein